MRLILIVVMAGHLLAANALLYSHMGALTLSFHRPRQGDDFFLDFDHIIHSSSIRGAVLEERERGGRELFLNTPPRTQGKDRLQPRFLSGRTAASESHDGAGRVEEAGQGLLEEHLVL